MGIFRCFVDGSETNLKVRRIVSPELNAMSFAELGGLDAHIECSLPDHQLYKFRGSIGIEGGDHIPCNENNMVLAVCILEFAYIRAQF